MTMSNNLEPHDIVKGRCRKCGKTSFEEGCPFGVNEAKLDLQRQRAQQGTVCRWDSVNVPLLNVCVSAESKLEEKKVLYRMLSV